MLVEVELVEVVLVEVELVAVVIVEVELVENLPAVASSGSSEHASSLGAVEERPLPLKRSCLALHPGQ